MENKTVFRQNKNFLFKPIYILDEVKANKIGHKVTICDGLKEYNLSTAYKLPTKKDQLILYYMLMKCQRLQWTNNIKFTKYEILKNCSIQTNSRSYDRLEDTLERWERIHIKFKDSFVKVSKKNGTTYIDAAFGIIDSYKIIKNDQQPYSKGLIMVRFSQEWLSLIQTSPFFQNLNFNYLKTLRKPLHFRFYEIIIKQFYSRKTWEIDAIKLAEQFPISVRYASDVTYMIKPALKKLNSVLKPVKIRLSVRSPKRGTAIYKFTIHNPSSQPLEQQIDEDTKILPKIQAQLPGFDIKPNDHDHIALTKFTNNLSVPDNNGFEEKPKRKTKNTLFDKKTAKKQTVALIQNMLEENDVENLQKFKKSYPSCYKEAVRIYKEKTKQ